MKSRTRKIILNLNFLWPLSFWVFLAVKLGGTVLATWSWWWVLMPMVPVMWLLLALSGAAI